MKNIERQVNAYYEATVFLGRRLNDEEITSTSQMSENTEFYQKLKNSYKNLESAYQKICDKYQDTIELIHIPMVNSLWIGKILTNMLYLNNKVEKTPNAYIVEIYDLFQIDSKEPSEEGLLEVLMSSELSDKQKWNLFLIYKKFDEFTQEYKRMIDELSESVKEELPQYNVEVERMLSQWNETLKVFQYHIKLDEEIINEVHFTPTVFDNNSLSLWDRECLVGVLVDRFFKDDYTEEKIAKMVKVLGDVSKFKILAEVAKKPMYGKELADYLSLTPATISYHLNELLGAGLVKVETNQQKKVYYEVNRSEVESLLNAIKRYLLEH